VVPGAIELIVDRSLNPTEVEHSALRAGSRQHVPLRAARTSQELDDTPLPLDRVPEYRAEGAGPLGVQAEYAMPAASKSVATSLARKRQSTMVSSSTTSS
jgi:hypothetical protein